ncbi:hypothetical protein ACP4OV_029212 [Aristida adscensionis]
MDPYNAMRSSDSDSDFFSAASRGKQPCAGDSEARDFFAPPSPAPPVAGSGGYGAYGPGGSSIYGSSSSHSSRLRLDELDLNAGDQWAGLDLCGGHHLAAGVDPRLGGPPPFIPPQGASRSLAFDGLASGGHGGHGPSPLGSSPPLPGGISPPLPPLQAPVAAVGGGVAPVPRRRGGRRSGRGAGINIPAVPVVPAPPPFG